MKLFLTLPVIFLFGCVNSTPYVPANPQNTKNSYNNEISADQYAKEHRCTDVNSDSVNIKKTPKEYESVGAFDINASDYIFGQPCAVTKKAFDHCKNTDRSVDNCVAGVMYLSGFKSKNNLNKKQPNEQKEDVADYGNILNVQIANLSTGATSGGANLGSIVSQANYIDSTNYQNYSATSQVGVAILGAMVGGMLDTPAVTKYRITYLIQMTDGEVKKLEKIQSNDNHIPSGVCVHYKNSSSIEIVNQNKCNAKK